MLSFGHAIYFGLAGYSTIHFVNLIGEDVIPYIPISLMPIFGALIGLLFGVAVGYVSTRRAGTTFAMISLGFGEMVTALTLILVAFFNGEEGIQTDRWVGPEPLGITFGPDIQVYYLIAVWCLICMLAMYGLTKTPFGRICNAVRDNPERVEFIGYNRQRIRWLAFSLSGMFAGAAGALHALNFEHVGFEAASIQQSGLVLFMAYIGGVGSFIGPILGAILITFLNGVLSDVTEAWFLYLGLLFVTIVVFAPFGLAGLIMMHETIWQTDARLLRGLIVPYALAIGSTLIALVGVIGLIEIVYFLSTSITRGSEMVLYGIAIDGADITPWLVCAVIAGIGIVLCRKTYPVMASRWNEAFATAKERFAQ
jgi:branched-chain amino acid transport system permease protein